MSWHSLSSLVRVSHPSQVVLPFPHWEPKEKPVKEDEVGPQVTHIYEVNAQHHGSVGGGGRDSALADQRSSVLE